MVPEEPFISPICGHTYTRVVTWSFHITYLYMLLSYSALKPRTHHSTGAGRHQFPEERIGEVEKENRKLTI